MPVNGTRASVSNIVVPAPIGQAVATDELSRDGRTPAYSMGTDPQAVRDRRLRTSLVGGRAAAVPAGASRDADSGGARFLLGRQDR